MILKDDRKMSSRDPCSEDDDEDCNESIYVNAEDGLSLTALDQENESRHQMYQRFMETGCVDGMDLDSIIEDEDFPTVLIVSGLSSEFFDSERLKASFEELFKRFGEDVTFHYFKSFKRVRVGYASAASAIQARIKMHLMTVGEDTLKCYFGQPSSNYKCEEERYLKPPTPDKQFLISPPASPPVDWKPRTECHPCIDYDLIAALARLGPGESHELHKPEKDNHPSIVVHIVPDSKEEQKPEEGQKCPKPKIKQTRRPET